MEERKESRFQYWLKRVGLAGFLFFLIKGLVWIGVAAAVGFGVCSK